MGSVLCCVAARERNIPDGLGNGATRNSPAWSFRRDNRRRVADEIEYPLSFARDLATLPASLKPPYSEMGIPSVIPRPSIGTSLTIRSPADVSLASPVRAEVKNSVESPDIVSTALPKPSSSTSVCPLPPAAPTHWFQPRTIPSAPAQRSPGDLLSRQVSNNQTLGLKSPNDNATSEGRWSFMHSTRSNDFATGSHYASSEGGLSGGGSGRFSCSHTVDQQRCGNCLKLLTERSAMTRLDLPVTAVLACGHVYHAECLEIMTSETEKYDPMCPICTLGEEKVAKISRNVLKAEAGLRAKNCKRSKNRVADSYAGSEYDELVVQNMGKQERKALKMNPSSSTKGSSSNSYLKWDFGSKWSKPIAGDSTSNKSFWSRHNNKNENHSSSNI